MAGRLGWFPVVVVALLLVSSTGVGYEETDGVSTRLATHQFILAQALKILENDGYPHLAQLLRAEYFHDISRGTARADQTLIDSREHYNDPVTHDGLLGFRSARELADERYAAAVAQWNAGNRHAAMFEVGWTVHLVADQTVPHHTRLTFLDNHAEYEAWVRQNQEALAVDSGGVYGFNNTLSGHYENESIASHWVDYNGHFGWGFFPLVDGPDGVGDNDYAAAATVLVPLAQRTSAGFLLRFLRDVGASPTAVLGAPFGSRVGLTSSFSAVGSVDDLGIASIAWDFGDGSQGTGLWTSKVYASSGVYTVALTVTDLTGATTTNETTVLVLDDERPRAAIGGPRVGAAGDTVHVDASNSSGLGLRFTWYVDGAPQSSGPDLDVPLAVAGPLVVTLVASDAFGRQSRATHVVWAFPAAPDIVLAPFTAAPESAALLAVTGPSNANYRWFVAGQRFEGAAVEVPGLAEGAYTVTLVVSEAGARHRLQTTLTVAT